MNEVKSFIKRYLSDFATLPSGIAVICNGKAVDFTEGIRQGMEWLQEVRSTGCKIIFIGNGGSAAIASHQAVDYWKNGGIKAIAFNDSSLLTCISNDYNYAEVFAKPMDMFAEKGDLAICISSSGSSENIINGAKQAKQKRCRVISLSGFEGNNPLRALGELSFYVPSRSYGFVEIIHLFICHCLLDAGLYCMDGVDVFDKNKRIKNKD